MTFLPRARAAEPRGDRRARRRLHRARRDADPADRRRAAGAARDRASWSRRLGERLGNGPRRADPHHQRHPARPLRGDAARGRRPPDQRQPRQPRSGPLPPHHPARRPRRRCSAASRRPTAAGLAVKINMVALKGLNEDEIAPMLRWCAARGPRPDPDRDHAARRGRGGPHRPLSAARRGEARGSRASSTLIPSLAPHRRPGALLRGRRNSGIRLGLITPLTGNFCAGCNRIRVAATGTVYGCLGHDQKVELRDLLRRRRRGASNEALDG